MTARNLLLKLVGNWETHCADLNTVALTFDDGPHPDTTEKLLNALDKLEIRTTMFVNGSLCRGQASLLREIEARGHVLANHGYIHKSHAFRRKEFVQNSILQTQFTLEDFGVCPARLFRPPYGAIDWNTAQVTRDMRFQPVLWSAHVADWKPQSAEQLRQRMRTKLNERMILLLHDGKETTEKVIEALPQLRDDVIRRGWAFVTLDSGLKQSGATA